MKFRKQVSLRFLKSFTASQNNYSDQFIPNVIMTVVFNLFLNFPYTPELRCLFCNGSQTERQINNNNQSGILSFQFSIANVANLLVLQKGRVSIMVLSRVSGNLLTIFLFFLFWDFDFFWKKPGGVESLTICTMLQ